MDETQGAIDQAAAAAKARFEAMARKALERGERDRELAARVQAMTATVSSRRKEVAVTVDHGGRVTDMQISDRGVELSGQELSRVVLETIRQAGQEVGEVGRGGCPRVLGGTRAPKPPGLFPRMTYSVRPPEAMPITPPATMVGSRGTSGGGRDRHRHLPAELE